MSCNTESGSVSPLNLSGFGLKSAVPCKIGLWPGKLAAGESPTVSICIQSSCSFWQSHRLYPTHRNLPQSLFLTFHVFSSDNIFNYNTQHECGIKIKPINLPNCASVLVRMNAFLFGAIIRLSAYLLKG